MKTALMALMLGAAACALGDGWGDAMRQAQGLQILHRLGLNRTQLQAAAPLADKLRESRAKTEHLRTEAVTGFKDGLSLQREALLSGPAAEDAVETAAEVHRILKPGGLAILYETTRDYDRAALATALRDALKSEGMLRRLLAPRLLAKQLSETYSNDEIRDIVSRTPFGPRCVIEPFSGRLPIWVRVSLAKTAA